MGNRSVCRLLVLLGILLAWPAMAAAGDLGSAQLLIAGSRLTVSPESQTVPFDTPTIVETHLEGYDTSRGTLPADLRVLADLTGPEVDGVLVLETTPNQPFRIPRLRLQGEYRLDNIRLVQGSTLLAYAAPRSSSVLVTQVLITKVTSRALTLDEIRSYGIVVDDSSFQAFNFTFAFAVAGETINYNVPVIYQGPASDPAILWEGPNYEPSSSWRSSSARFEPPRMAPFQLQLAGKTVDDSNGGCDDPEGDCVKPDVIPIPGVILFPTDISLLHQFFSVVLMAQNGAPAGDRLTIRDLTARVTLPPGLRQAKTDPPTALGVPVPVRVPGPDGKLGTADDITFLVAQATGQAEVEVEGLSEGTHLVQFDLEGILEGLPGGQISRITGQARGAVIVRDPTLNVTITHPDTVRTDEEYTMLLTVTNTGNVPANQLKVRLPAEKLSGVQVVGESEKTVTVQPGDAEILDFRLRSHRTGRVTATAARSDSSALSATFDLTVGVGENGIPLSPNAIILPRSTDSLPQDLMRNGLNLIGLGFSLATAPPALLKADQPRLSRALVDGRIYAFAQAGKQVSLGEELFDSAAGLAAEWTGVRDADWDWDLLRRTTQKGAQVGASLGTIFAAEAAAQSPQEAFDRFAKTTGYLPAMEGALATGSGVTLEVTSRASGLRLAGDGNDSARLRALPFADLYSLGGAQMALLAVPEDGGYRARVRASAGVLAGLHLLVPGSDGALRMVRWTGVSLAAGGTATVDFRAADSSFTLAVDTQGDGTVDDQIAGSVEVLQRRPFQAIAAVQNVEVDPTGHVVDVLFSADVDPRSLIPSDARKFTIPGKVSNGGSVKAEEDVTDGAGNTTHNPFAGLRNTRIVRVVFNNPLSPYTPQSLTVSGVQSPLGEQVTSATVPVQTAAAQPGTQVAGTVYGSDGLPVPFAQVELRESDPCLFCEEACRTHKTAVVQADASGHFLFDYVRQTGCSDVYQLKAIDATSAESGTATGRVRFVGQVVQLDVVMLGRGTVRGRVTYDDGTVPAGARVIAESPVFRQGRSASLDANGNYSVTNVPVGTITLSATDGQGRFTVTTLQIPDAGSVVTHDLVILRRPDQPISTGGVRGVIYRPDGTTPVSGAYVALYVDGNLVGVKNSAADGTFDFGLVPAGRGEVETFEGATGQSGVQVFFDVQPDQVNQVNLVMQDKRGVVQGHVYRRSGSGTVPVFGAVVWAEGTPFQTVTGPDGSYKLEGVYTGTRNISAADPQKKVKVTEAVTVGSEGQVVDRDLYFQDTAVSGIAGVVLGFDGAPVSGATVHLANGDQYWFRTATTDSSGHFLISDLGAGSYGVHAFKGAAGGSQGATVRFAGDTPFVTIQFKKGSIHGVVRVDTNGTPVGTRAVITYRTTTVRLELVGLDLESHTLETNADGTFDLPDVLAGAYVITATNAFYGSKTVRGTVAGDGTETVEVTFDGTATGKVRGVVLAPDGVTPVSGATVKLRHPSFSVYDLTTGADGSFDFELVPPVAASFPVEVTASDGVIFRQAQAWVQLNKPGQELDLEIVLPKQGSISGQVQDANGTPVPGAVVTLQEGSYPRRNLIVNADAGGNFAYQNVFAGTVTLSAKAPSLGGLGGKTTAEITAEGQEVTGVVISLEPTGGIAGLVTSPVDGSAVPAAEVHLMRGGRLFDTVTAGPDGRFEFSLLPLASYDVTAFDPRTGRFGRRLGVAVIANVAAAGDLQLEARGSVTGHLYEAGTTAGVPGGTIRLQAYSITGFTTYSSTDAGGVFEFQGIPQGTFDLFGREPVGRRRATGRGEIVSEGQQVTVDLYLDPQATLFGSVLNPLGAADGVFPNANTVIYQDGQIIGATLDSNYSFPGVVVGRPYELYTQEVGGPHQGQVLGRLTQDGQVRVDVRMHPLGSVVVNVVDSFGHPVPSAHVDLWDQGFYGDYSGYTRFQGDTGSDNSITFQTVGEGKLSVYVTDPATGLKGSAAGWLTQEGQIVELNVALQNTAAITGHAVLADGTTPAAQALVAIQAGGLTLTVYTDDAGAFTLSSIPLGSFLLVLEEHLGPGTREVRGNLATNGQVLDLGTVVLDATDPQLISVAPAPGAVDVSRNATVTVRFSEPMDTTRNLIGNEVRIETAAGQLVGADAVWMDGDTAIQLTPRQPLANASIFRVKVDGNLIFDKAGRQLAQSLQTTFTTADQVPPAVIAVTPANNARQVPLASPVTVTFSEVVNPSTLSGSALQLTDVTAGAGVTTTYLLDATGRTVTVTPAAGLVDGHRYQLAVQGVADTVGNAMTVPFSTAFQALDATAPAIAVTSPAEGAQATSGDRLTVSADVTDLSAVTGVTLRAGTWVLAKTAAPYSWQIPAPAVTTAGPVSLQVEAVDEWGNRATATRTLQVSPRANASAPQVAILCLPGSVPPGLEMAVPFHASDDESVAGYRLLVNGQETASVPLADQASVDSSFLWTVPASAQPGDVFTLRIEATDFAGNVGTAEAAVTVAAGTVLTASRTLDGSFAGQALVLSQGTFTLTAPLHLSALTLTRGARLTAAAGSRLDLSVDGRLDVGCDASIDASKLGFAGGNGQHAAGYAPDGVTASQGDSGGSHGGVGDQGGATGAPGAVYDGVYQPALGGAGGGFFNNQLGSKAGAGGGVIFLTAGELVLEGRIVAQGETRPASNELGGGGAGGSVSVHATTLRGGGSIDASGGDGGNCSAGVGGGGRVALQAGTLTGFDPAGQVKAWGGTHPGCNGLAAKYAAPGTVYVVDSTSTYGRLIVDAGQAGGADRTGPATELPDLGTGAVTAWSAAGADAWVSATAPFKPEQLGAWMVLKDGSGAALGGGFQVVEIDAQGRARLAGAAAVSGAAAWSGEYRFDSVDLRHGAGLRSTTPVSGQEVVLQGDAAVAGDVTAVNLMVKAGARVHPVTGGTMRFHVGGRMTVESGAVLDVRNLGYAGGNTTDHNAGYGPPEAAPSQPATGGSHGGAGGPGTNNTGPAGGVFDSVYLPGIAGGGGGITYHSFYGRAGGAGGGVVAIDAAELVLDGQILASGETRPTVNEAGGGGAGGTVAVQAGTLSGAGSIDVSGGDAMGCGGSGGAGGGGRVALQVQTFAGFDPSAQVKAWGGVRKDCEGTSNQAYYFGATGTIYAADSTSTYGRLILDAGQQNGADRTGVATELPELAGGTVAGFQAAGADAWVTAAAPFQPEWLGTWMTLQDAAGAPLGGGFQVAEIDAQGRARLAGAGGVSGAASYRGEYRFDTVALSHGAGLWSRSPVMAQDMTLAGTAGVGDGVSAGSLTVLAGAVVRPVSGQTLHLKATGTLTVQAGGRLDVTGLGYPGSGHSNVDGGAPSGVQGAQGGAGGSHGGTGATASGASANGEVYDSLFTPALGGGGGSYAGIYYSLPGVAGGGAVQIEAGTLDLEGEIRARGVDDDDTANAAGAGGAVWITAGALTGAGRIDASGGFARSCFYQRDIGSGGGGRVALSVGAFTGFDPATQVLAQGGGHYNCDRSSATYAAPGTVFSKLPSQTYGALRVDQGAGATGSPTVASTALPGIGRGTVGAVTASGSDLWITPQDATAKFSLGVPGMWVVAGGADYLVIDESPDRRQLLLAGAAGHVAVGDAFHGEYKLDALSVLGGAKLAFGNDVVTVTGATTVDPSSSVQYADYNAPAVTINQPSATTFTAGDPITVAATASDDVAVSQVTFSLGGSSSTDSQSPYQWSISAPPVATATDLELRAEATDSSGNIGAATRTLHIQPLAPTAPPSVSFTYPGAGALLPVGAGLDLQLQATDDRGVQRVELYLDNGSAPVTVLTAAPYTYHLSAPAGAVDGQILNLRAVAYDYSLQTAEATVAVRVVEGTVISQSRTLSATDTSLDNTTVILSGSTILTVTGPHTFRDLVVLNGTKVTHPATTAAQEYHLDLTIQRDLFVAQGGTIDVSGRGYLGGSGSQRAYGYGNVQTEGANPGVGGSHGGRGGSYDGSGLVYGSFYDPADPGAGGGASTSYGGESGGGVVRVTATGNVVIDGTVLANGATGGFGAGGAGGSIRLNGAAIRGAGSIRALGSGSSGGTLGGGSGGRIALYAATIDPGLVSRTVAAGGTSSISPATWGAAGTVFVKPDSQEFGDLILDNAGNASSQLTELLPVGSGVIDAVSADGLTFTDNEADFRHILGAADAVFNGDFAHPCPIAGNDHHGKSLILKTPLAATCTALPHVNDTYQGLYRFNRVIVRNGAQGIARDTVTLASPNTPEVASGSSWSSGYAPTIQITSPAAGSSFISGANVPAGVSVTDALGVVSVAWSFASQSATVTISPYSWTAIAPEVTQTADYQLTAVATDLSGNLLTASQTVHVNPAVDPTAPVVTLASCRASGVPANAVNPGDLVAPGVAIAIPFVAVDDQAVQSYSLVVDGTTVQTVGNLNQASVSASLAWTPPANAAPGTTFNLRVEARDFSGKVGSTALTLSVPTGTILTGTQSLTSAVNGQPLILGSGTFTVQQPISPASLRLLSGARVVGLSTATMSIDTGPGALIVQCGAVLDVSALGYAGSTSGTVAGGAPSGVAGSVSDSGGSHGGVGQVFGNPGPAGAVFDSVYQPQLGGGGGSLKSTGAPRHGGNGGGTLALSAGQIVLDGQILAKGDQQPSTANGESSGAGGSVQITATGTLSGAGLIDVSGGDRQSTSGSSTYNGGSGGGGRVALKVGALSGFDPVTQVKAWGGTIWNNTTPRSYAGPGTIWVKTGADTYGRLIVDSGKEASGVERVGPQTPLPSLGTGAVTAFQAQGADALVTAGSAFQQQWLGAWMALVDAAGQALGSFQVQSIDSQGRALLTGAAGAATAASYRGQYLFDQMDLKSGAGLSATDELKVSGNVLAESRTRLPAALTAANVTVKAGSYPVTLAQGGTLSLTVSGALTIESGAALDVTALGYAGGLSSSQNAPGTAPAGVTPSATDAGGSHGGLGTTYDLAGPAGDVYDSVYLPQLGGGGGSVKFANTSGDSGGGVVSLNVGQLVLNGQILAKGEMKRNPGYTDASGAGGTVLVVAGTLSGTGSIDASGGDYQSSSQHAGSGGGGRVALHVGTLSGFDPAAQVKAWGGTVLNGTTVVRYAGPGTVFVQTTGQTYGRLIVDSGKDAGGAERFGPQTPLPVLGTGTATAFQAQGADAWLSASAAFKSPWLGAWMALQDAAGAALGSFQVLSIDAQGRVLLKGAAAASTATQYRGQYLFDQLDLKSGAGLSATDELKVSGNVLAEAKTRLPATFSAGSMTVKAGSSPVTLAQGGTLSLTVSGQLTVEAGAVLDVTALGYIGGQSQNAPGTAPSGVTVSATDAGGSHGGLGTTYDYTGPAGEVYDSAYQPQLGGGGGSVRFLNTSGDSGGGVISLNAGQLVLDGQLRAKGEMKRNPGYTDATGAGGTVLITAGTLSGAGSIDASGADYQASSQHAGSGGGGRVALYVDTLSGFDPSTQVKVWGGTVLNGTTVVRYAAPGTVFVKLPSQTYGKLYVNQGGIVAGKSIPNTPLPTIGTGTVGTATADTLTPTALWITPSDSAAKFSLGVIGMWVKINSSYYRVVDQSADRRQLLLAGAAGAVQTGDAYRGIYRFDEVIVLGGAKLQFLDDREVTTITKDSTSQVIP